MALPVPVIAGLQLTNYGVSNVTDMTLTKPAGIQVGDLLVICAAAKYNSTVTMWSTPTGWMQVGQVGNTVVDVFAGIWWRRAGVADTGNVTLASSYSSKKLAWLLRITGADFADPIDDSNFQTDSTGNTQAIYADSGDVVTTVANTLALGINVINNANGMGTITVQSGWTQEGYEYTNTGTAGCRAMLQSDSIASASNIGSVYNNLSAYNTAAGGVIAIKPRRRRAIAST